MSGSQWKTEREARRNFARGEAEAEEITTPDVSLASVGTHSEAFLYQPNQALLKEDAHYYRGTAAYQSQPYTYDPSSIKEPEATIQHQPSDTVSVAIPYQTQELYLKENGYYYQATGDAYQTQFQAYTSPGTPHSEAVAQTSPYGRDNSYDLAGNMTSLKVSGASTDTHSRDTTSPPEPPVVPNERRNAGTEGMIEQLDKSYSVRSTDYKKFFQPGRVFATRWSDIYSKPGNSSASTITESLVYFDKCESVCPKIRRFVVVQSSERESTCLPVTTYNGQGYHKRNIVLADHGFIYVQRKPTPVEGIHLASVKVELSRGGALSGDPSLINYAKIYAVENNVKVKDIGTLASKSIKTLLHNYDWVNRPVSPPPNIPADDSYLKKAAGVAFEVGKYAVAAYVGAAMYDSLGNPRLPSSGGNSPDQTPTSSNPTLGTYNTDPYSEPGGDRGSRSRRNRHGNASGEVAELAGNSENSRRAHRRGETRATSTREGGGSTSFQYSNHDQYRDS